MPVIRKVSAERSKTTSHSRSSTRAAHVTTTTVQSTNTAAPNASHAQSSNLSVEAVVGSVVGGVVLGIVVVLGWAYWRKSFRRRQQDHACTTKRNTHRYSSQRARWQPFSVRSSEKKQRLEHCSANSTGEKAGAYDRKTRVFNPDAVESVRQLSLPQVVFKPAHIPQSRKDRKRKQTMDRKPPLSPIADVDNETVDAPFEEQLFDPFADTNTPIIDIPATVSRKPSTVGSASVYSAQSGEERQYVVSPSFGALGPPGLDNPVARPPPSISHKSSNVSSVYSRQSGEERQFGVPSNFTAVLDQDWRLVSAYTHSSGSFHSTAEEQLSAAWVQRGAKDAGGRDATQLSRLSQNSATSVDSRVDDRSAVGVAYGGD